MLVELVVENYAVVEKLRVNFHAGLNLLTGETGSGKSIVVDALGLLLGARASSEAIRTGEPKARVTGIFAIDDRPAVRRVLESAGIDLEDSELLVEREILAGGKSRAFIGSRPVSASLLRDLAPFLADIHGQHDQQLLFSPESQREMLDASGAYPESLLAVDRIYRDWRRTASELEEIEKSEQEKLRMLDLWSFQRKEIESAELEAGEDAALENERRILQNVQRLEEAANTAYTAVYDAPESAVALTRVAAKKVEELKRIDDSVAFIAEQLNAAGLSLQEASYALRDYLSKLEANPGRLEEVETRLAAIERLKRKYAPSVAEILAFLEDVRSKIDAVENSGAIMERLRKQQDRLAAEYRAAANELTAQRRGAARKLAKRVEAELAQLAMPAATFEIRLTESPWSHAGADHVEFLISANAGEEARPLEKVASGGELSRIALALKTCLTAEAKPAKNGAVRTLVFDEVDAGVGGAAAEGIGRRLKKLSHASQVLCVTHLAQVASFADHHYVVEKRESKGRTTASVEELDAAGRTREVGRMLSGQKLTPEALKHAERMIRMGAE